MSLIFKAQSLLKSPHLQKLFANVGHMVFENLLKLVVGFFVSIWVARALGPDSYGQYNYILSYCALFSPFFVMGVDDVLTKELVEKPEQTDPIMATMLGLKFTGGVIGLLLSFVSITFLSDSSLQVKGLVYVYSFCQLAKTLDIINTWFLAQIKAKVVAMGRNVILVLSSTLKAFGVLSHKDWTFFVYISCFDLVALAIFYLLAYFKSGKRIHLDLFDSNRLKSYLKQTVPLFLVILFTMAIAKIDHLMIESFLGNRELGLYAAAVKLVDLWHFIPIAIVSTLFPRVIAAHQVSVSRYHRHKLTLLSLMFWSGTLFAIAVGLLSDVIVSVLYGEKYQGTDALLGLYAWLAIFVFLTFTRVKMFLLQKRVLDGVILLGTIAVLNIALNLILIPRFGTKGAIVASLGSYLSADLVLACFHRNIRRNARDILYSVVHPFKMISRSS